MAAYVRGNREKESCGECNMVGEKVENSKNKEEDECKLEKTQDYWDLKGESENGPGATSGAVCVHSTKSTREEKEDCESSEENSDETKKAKCGERGKEHGESEDRVKESEGVIQFEGKTDEELVRLVGAGKRSLVMDEPATAVENFQLAAQIVSEKYGEMATECAEVFYLYGTALLELARKENGIFGSDFEWKGATGSDDDGGADGGDGGADGGDGGADGGDGGADGGDGGADGGDGGADGGDGGEDGGGVDGGDGGADGGDGGEDGGSCSVGTMQLAWEMLELSKVLFLRREDKEGKLAAAQAYLKLGELGLETESFTQAVEDLKVCLALQSPFLAPSSRLLAQTHYQLGLALFLSQSFIPSALHFLKASHALSLRLELVRDSDPVESKELEGLLKELQERGKDAEESARATHEVPRDSASPFQSACSSRSVEGEARSIQVSNVTSDITHLVRKKKSEEKCVGLECVDKEVKRTKLHSEIPSQAVMKNQKEN
uniref:histone-binding protein N1/N2-like isoform X2 n=1 Tax=Myxine glutinosa TaxID=7769 RepID=UPI00358F2C9B